MLNEEDIFRRLLDVFRDAVSVTRAEEQRSENQEIERSLQESGAARHSR